MCCNHGAYVRFTIENKIIKTSVYFKNILYSCLTTFKINTLKAVIVDIFVVDVDDIFIFQRYLTAQWFPV